MNEEREKPNGIYGHWAKHLIENGTEEEDDIDDDEEDYDLGVYDDDDSD
tara:strand:+ start:1514 stop:1660 length:147 start_codon:yes stop_codon:yes gene_type:complete